MIIDLEETVKRLKKGLLVAVPTETVYGLAASIHHPKAIDAIFQLKGRPLDNPLIVHVASLTQCLELTSSQPPRFKEIVSYFWPGPLTCVLPARCDRVSARVRGGLETVAIRMPDHPLTLEVIRQIGPIVAPSANLSGSPSSTLAKHVEADFGVDFPILSDGSAYRGVESTIIGYRNDCWQIYRQGAISEEELEEVIGIKIQESTQQEESRHCPGQRYRHYSPKTRLILGEIPFSGGYEVVVGFRGRSYEGAKKVYLLGDLQSPKGVQMNLYKILRQLDVDGITSAWVDVNFESKGPLRTVLERLKKACQSGD